MNSWNTDEPQKIASTDDLHISPFREDGKTYGTPTWIWSVSVGEEMFVRAYYGVDSRWYKSALIQKAGRIHAAGMTKEVAFQPVNGPILEPVDEAYRKKYADSPYLDSMISAQAKAATIKVIPRGN